MSGVERVYDLSVRLLMAVTMFVMLICMAFLTYRWQRPVALPPKLVPLTEIPAKPAPMAVELSAAEQAQALSMPVKIFKCYSQGRLILSDRSCSNDRTPDAAQRPDR